MTTKHTPNLFREEAVQHAAMASLEGDVLRLSPAWTRWAYWILVLAFALALAYGAFGTFYQYGRGPAVVQVAGGRELTSAVSGTVESIAVQPGQRVAPGDVLVRLHAASEAAELAELERAFEQEIVKTLRDPGDQAAREALGALRTRKEIAAAQVAERSVRATRAGIVGDIRIHRGQLLERGDIVLTLLGDDARYLITAILPGQHRPEIRPGMRLRFEVDGYRHAYQELTVESVGAHVIGPNEVKRYLGQESADTVRIDGPVVLVLASSPASTFQAFDRTLELHSGMSGRAEVRFHKERILLSLMPGLRTFFRGGHG
jgi:membrane fusion protein (multidrug efflux system)